MSTPHKQAKLNFGRGQTLLYLGQRLETSEVRNAWVRKG